MYEASRIRQSADASIAQERLAILRTAVRNRSLSFPAQIPEFAHEHRRDVQWRVVALYFVRGWSCRELARRYVVTPGRIRQLIREWVEWAAALGYLQRIPPEAGAIPVAVGTPARSMVYRSGLAFPSVAHDAIPLRAAAGTGAAPARFAD